MIQRHTVSAIACALLALLLGPCFAATAARGEWKLSFSGSSPNEVRLGLNALDAGQSFNDARTWPVGDLRGLDAGTAKHDVHFMIVRDAGQFELQGALANGGGGGTFEFAASASYAEALRAMGMLIDGDFEQMAMAALDVSLSYAREMQGLHLTGLTSGKLVAFRAQGVTRQYVEELRAAGLRAESSGNLIAFRAQGVSPEMIKSLHQLGYANPRPEDLIAMRATGVTPEYIAGLQAQGVRGLTLEQLIGRHAAGQ